MAVLNSIGGFFGNIQAGYDDRLARGRQAREAEALQKIIALEQQRQQAENPQIPLRPQTFDRPEELELHQAYGRAGLDPKRIAEAQTAQLASEAFANAIPNITSDVGRINIGLGKEYRPDVYRADEIKANEAQIRLNTIENLLNRPDLDPLLAADISQNKSVFDVRQADIEGPDGKHHKGFVRLTPSGDFIHATATDVEGQPLIILPESAKPTADMQNTQYYAQLWDMTETEASKILKSRTTDTPAESWAKIVNSNSKNRFGSNVRPYDMLKNSLMVWNTARQGQELPIDIKKTISTYGLNERQADELQGIADQINENARLISLSNLAEKEQAASGTANLPPANIPGSMSLQQQPQQNIPFYQMPGAAGVQPIAPAPVPEPAPTPQPELQPLTPVAIQAAWSEIQKGTNPKEVQKGLQQDGFDLSPQAVDMMAIEAVNLGVPADVLQQYLNAIGIEWQPT